MFLGVTMLKTIVAPLIHFLGGLTKEEARSAIQAELARERHRGRVRWTRTSEQLKRGVPDYGIPPLEEYQINGLLSGVE